MARRPQTSFFTGDLNALGVPTVGDDNATLYGPNGAPLSAAGAQQSATPLTGATVNMPDDNTSGTLYLTPAGTIAALTVNLPSNANSVIGQRKQFISSATVTALTIAQAGGGLVAGQGVPTTIGVSTPFTLQKVAANTWALAF